MGVGKTTLANDLSKALGHTLLPEAARVLIAEGYLMDKRVSIDTEKQLLLRQTSIEMMQGSWIADRCIIDILAYTMVLFPNHENFHKEIREELQKAEYDVILYIPPEFSIEDDGVRSTDTKFREKVNREIVKILRKENIPYHKITGNPEIRLQKAIEIISKVV